MSVNDLLVERVLRAVEQIPSGAVASYGDIANIVGTGPRQVGKIMAHWGGDVPWWRVVRADGSLPAGLAARARHHWAAEDIAYHGDAARIRQHRADLDRLQTDCDLACQDLSDPAG